jgi:hypothetical protein
MRSARSDVLQGNAQSRHTDTKADYLAEMRFNRETAHRSFPALRDGCSAMIPHLLRSAVFSIGPPSGLVERSFRVHRHDSVDVQEAGQDIRYVGPQLGQVHKRAIYALVLRAAGKSGAFGMRFHARELLESMGRDHNTTNIEALKRVLGELRAATFTVRQFDGDRGHIFGFVSNVDWKGRMFSIDMDPRFAAALAYLSASFIPMQMRNQLADGVQTALADLVFATRTDFFQISALAQMWEREPVQLGRDLTVALKRLHDVGLLASYERKRGHFKIERAHWFAKR